MKRRTIAGLIALLPLAMGAEGGCGDQVDPIATAPAPKAADPEPHIEESKEPKKVLFAVTLDRARAITVTWKIDGAGESEKVTRSIWKREEIAFTGSVASLTVEQDERGGFTQCEILVNGKMDPIWQVDHGFNPYMHRNDAGDCKVTMQVR